MSNDNPTYAPMDAQQQHDQAPPAKLNREGVEELLQLIRPSPIVQDVMDTYGFTEQEAMEQLVAFGY
jgi:hypothetical protein